MGDDSRGWENDCVERAMQEHGWSRERAEAYCWGARNEDVTATIHAEIGEIPETRPAAWVHECIRQYMAKGMSREEASQRCYGAYHNQSRSLEDCGCMRRVTLTNVPEGVIDGTLALWGSPAQRDEYGTWFDRNDPPEMGLRFLPFPLMYEHAADPELRYKIIGEVFTVWPTSSGIEYRAKLDRKALNNDEFERIIEEIERGELYTSTGSATHLMEFDDNGKFVNWPLSEVTLTKRPAEQRMPAVAVVRSKNKIKPDALTEDNPCGCGNGSEKAKKTTVRGNTRMDEKKNVRMPLDPAIAEPLQALIDEWGEDVVYTALEAMMGMGGEPEVMSEQPAETAMLSVDDVRSFIQKQQDKRKGDETAAALRGIQAQLDKLSVAQQAEQPAPQQPELVGEPQTRSATGHRITGLEPRKFVGKSGFDLATAYMVKRARVDESVRNIPGVKLMSDEFMRALAERAFSESERNVDPAIEAVRSLRYSGGPATRADVMGSDVTSYGDEWVAVFYEQSLWESIRIAPVWEAMRAKGLNEKAVPRGYESDVIPIEGADPTWYLVSQTANLSASGYPEVNIPASKVGTTNTTLTVKKVGALAWYSGELEEDSIVDAASQIRKQFEISGREQVEYLLLNGDTETAASTNINLVDGTPASNASYLAMDGMLKAPLITNTANALDCGATFDEDDFRILLTYLGTNGKSAADRRKLVYVMDFPTQDKAISIPAVKTQDVYSMATLENGELTKMWNVDILVSGQLALANTAGKISATAANNVKGRLLLVRPDQWWIGYKREMTVETDRNIIADATAIVARFRMGMVYRAVDDAAAVTYNIPV